MDSSPAFDTHFDYAHKNFNHGDTEMKKEKAMIKEKMDYFDLVLKTIIILGTVLVVYWFIQLMFGGSPGISDYNMGLILVLIGLVVHLYFKFGKSNQFIEGTFPRFEKNVESSFGRMKENMDGLKGSLDGLKKDMGLIKNKLKV